MIVLFVTVLFVIVLIVVLLYVIIAVGSDHNFEDDEMQSIIIITKWWFT